MYKWSNKKEAIYECFRVDLKGIGWLWIGEGEKSSLKGFVVLWIY